MQNLSKIQLTAIFVIKICGEKFYAMLVSIRMGTKMAAGKEQKRLSQRYATKA